MKTYFSAKPDKILYMQLPDKNIADCWLRKNITTVETEEGGLQWVADEVYLQTSCSLQEAEEQFDDLFFANIGPKPTEAERLDAIEAAIMDIMEVFCNG